MGIYAKADLEGHPPAKNRVWKNFPDVENRVGFDRDLAQCSRRENQLTATKTASDVPKGNISEYIDLSNGSVTAHLEYDAFGRTIASTGTPPANFGFSTKYQDEETGYYYYGFRYYDPETGRWPSRDPMNELGGYNLFGFLNNDGLNSWDYLGLQRGGIKRCPCTQEEIKTDSAGYRRCMAELYDRLLKELDAVRETYKTQISVIDAELEKALKKCESGDKSSPYYEDKVFWCKKKAAGYAGTAKLGAWSFYTGLRAGIILKAQPGEASCADKYQCHDGTKYERPEALK